MTDGLKSQEELALRAQAEQARARLADLTADLQGIDDQAASLAPERLHHELLEQACGSLEKLGELGAGSLFWGDRIEPARIAERLREVRGRVTVFQAQLDELDDRRRAILARIRSEEESLEILGEDLYQIREAEERRKLEWVVERDITPAPARVQIMAWARGGEDDRRFRRSLAASLLLCLLLGMLLPMIDLPLPARFEPDDRLPRRLAQLVRQERARPIPPPPVVAETPEPTPQQDEPEPTEQPKPSEQPLPPETPAVAAAEPDPSEWPGVPGPEPSAAAPAGSQRVAQAGILAFKDQFASLAQDRVAPRLGADARVRDAADASRDQMAARSMLTTNAPGSSGGINLATLNRNVGGGGGGGGAGGGGNGDGTGTGIEGVQVGRATSAIAAIGGGGGGDRPKSRGGPGLSRTDEEIQIVFDRYKASFYRLYNRELRNDPTLQGQMVLRLTIEPDGSVSMCVLQSSDMDAPELAAQVVNRVRTINFGAKDGVQAVTIVYPIDFLPAA